MNGAKMLRNVLQFEQRHSSIHLLRYRRRSMLVSLCNNERLWRRSNALKYSAPGQSMRPAELIAIPCETEPGLDIGAAHQRLCLALRRTYALTRWEADLFYRNHELISLVKCLIDDLGAWSRTARIHARSRGCLGPDRDAIGSGGLFFFLIFPRLCADDGVARREVHPSTGKRANSSKPGQFSKTGE